MAKPLFSFADIPEPSDPEPVKRKRVKSRVKKLKNQKTKTTSCGRTSRCASVVGEILKGHTHHIVSSGEWSAHDVIEHAVQQTGPAHLSFATWGISEAGVRTIVRLRDSGSLLSIRGVGDLRGMVHTPEANQLAKEQCDAFSMCSCHAKVYVLRNEQWGITIVSSANLTNNPRVEASVLTESPDVADWYRTLIEDLIERSRSAE